MRFGFVFGLFCVMVFATISAQASPPLIIQLPFYGDILPDARSMVSFSGQIELFVDDPNAHLDLIANSPSLSMGDAGKTVLVSRLKLQRISATQFKVIDVEVRQTGSVAEIIFKKDGVFEFAEAMHSHAGSRASHIVYSDDKTSRSIRFAIMAKSQCLPELQPSTE